MIDCFCFEVMAEPNRRKILRIVWDREVSAGDIARQFDVTFGAVSQHLHRLRDAGLLEMRKAGRTHFYRARKEALGPLAKALEAMWSDALDRLKDAVEAEATPKKRTQVLGSTGGRRMPKQGKKT